MARQKIACFDFDGVISKYEGWKGFDVFGPPIPSVIETMKVFKTMGWLVTIFTTRQFTPTMQKWLEDNGVPYDTINSTAHNPPHTSTKPIADVYVDDRAVRFEGQDAESLVKEMLAVEAGMRWHFRSNFTPAE
jgi:hypothetical protein